MYHAATGDQHYPFITQRREFAPHFEMPCGRFATVDTNCTIGISASGYILISTPHEPWSKPLLLYPASQGPALTAQPDAVPAQVNPSRIIRIVQRLREATKVMNRGRHLHRGHSCSTGKPMSRNHHYCFGRGNVIPNVCQLRVYKLSSSTFIGLP